MEYFYQNYWRIKVKKDFADSVLDAFPSNYVGSKRKILPWMATCLIENNMIEDNNWFLDMFGGSGIVSYYLSSLGLSGVVNDLMVSSSVNHVSIFSDSNPMFDSSLSKLPIGVEFIKYNYTDLDDIRPEGSKKDDGPMCDLFGDDDNLNEVKEKVASSTVFKSNNNVFNEVYKLLSHYILLHFTAKEAFEIACCITNSIIDQKSIYNIDTAKVKCLNFDCFSLLNYDFNKWNFNPDNCIVYIDPPYGGASSNYHKIYSVMECISFQTVKLKEQYDELKIGHEDEDITDLIFKPYIKNSFIKEWPHDVEELPHIKQNAWRFNTTNKLDFKVSFEKLISSVIQKGFKKIVFSFNKDSSWATPDELIELFKTKYNMEVIVSRVSYDYAYRTSSGASNQSMGNMTVGQDTEDVVGKKDTTSEEVLFMCKKGE